MFLSALASLASKALTVAYIAQSLTLSVAASGPNPDVVLNRAPYAVVEVARATITDTCDDRMLYGYDQKGFFIAYDYEGEGEYAKGQEWISFLFWNPENNCEDDIVARYDFRLN